jgi:SAM-dependent methyltransferase
MRSHKLNQFTGYMDQAVRHFAGAPPGLHLLDVPAGNGQVTEALRKLGHHVTPADINHRRGDYVFADMNRPLPFDDDAFDGVVCLEGIEHLLQPISLLGELIRVTRPGGSIVISTPNIMNMYSRLQFLFTGTFYQFNPAQNPQVAPGDLRDRFHIAPCSYYTLRYHAEQFGARVSQVLGDKPKRKALMPLYLSLLAAGRWWSRRLFFGRRFQDNRSRNEEIFRHINSAPLLFSRSLVLVLQKQAPTTVPKAAA